MRLAITSFMTGFVCLLLAALPVTLAVAQDGQESREEGQASSQGCEEAIASEECKEAGGELADYFANKHKACKDFRDCKRVCRNVKSDCKQECRDVKSNCKELCNQLSGKDKRRCKKECRDEKKSCKAECRSTKRICRTECKGSMSKECVDARTAWKDLFLKAPDCAMVIANSDCSDAITDGE